MRILLVLFLVGLLGGCGLFPEKPVATVKPFCRAITPETVSKDDTLTEKTASNMEANNRALQKLCPAS